MVLALRHQCAAVAPLPWVGMGTRGTEYSSNPLRLFLGICGKPPGVVKQLPKSLPSEEPKEEAA